MRAFSLPSRKEAVYEAFSEAVIGLVEAVLCIIRQAAGQHLQRADWEMGVRVFGEGIKSGVWAAIAAAHFNPFYRAEWAACPLVPCPAIGWTT
jgi:hypothetical protein